LEVHGAASKGEAILAGDQQEHSEKRIPAHKTKLHFCIFAESRG
jgi:hypothetical protein